MAWPTPQDYSEALQSPQTSFSDSELKAGQVETDKLGLPRPISGRFAIVYKMQCGQRQWAVRCFQSEVLDQQQRYGAISQHLQSSLLPYTVGFEFLPQGIRIGGQWYPILKMEWIAGLPLNTFIEQNLSDSAALIRLATSWVTMTDALLAVSVAHGDLQDGNVLVVGGNIKLIDYDGMYVPALAGRISNESGHRNYQHPNRTANDYDLYLDNFSNWVIYVSIIALAIDPTLWTRVKGGDECLLFRKEDFLASNKSTTLALLSKHSDARLRCLAGIFESLVYLLPAQVPPLATNAAVVSAAVPQTVSASPTGANAGSASWLSDHVNLSSGPVSLATTTTANTASSSTQTVPPLPTASPTWILDFVSPVTGVRTFENPVVQVRVLLALVLLIMVILPLLRNVMLNLFGESMLASIGSCLLIFFYRRDPAFRERSVCLARHNDQLTILVGFERNIKENETAKAAIREEERKKQEGVDLQHESLNKQEEREKQQAVAQLKSKTDLVQRQIDQLEKPLRTLNSNYQGWVARTNQQIAQINQAQASEISSALQPIQRQFVEDHLRHTRIEAGCVTGIGPAMAARLHAASYLSAADIDWGVQNVSGIGINKASTLIAWRQVIENHAKTRMPMNLSRTQSDIITAKYEGSRLNLQQQASAAKVQFDNQDRILRQQIAPGQASLGIERATAQQQFQRQTHEIVTRYLAEYTKFAHQKTALAAEYDKKCAEVDQQTAKVRKSIYDQNWQLAKARQELDAYALVTFPKFVRYLLLNRLTN